MTSVVNGPGNYIQMYWNGNISPSGTDFWTWFRSLNTQEWIGPFPLNGQAYLTSNERYSRWFVDTSSDPDFGEREQDGFYQAVTTVAFGPTDKPLIGVKELGMVKLICNPGGEINTKPYISNNEQREADTYYRPNY